MYRIINWFRGSVYLRVESASPEMFLNFCTRRGIGFWSVRRISATEVSLRVHTGAYRQLESVRGRGFEIKEAVSGGLPRTARSVRRRYALLAGVAAALLAVWVASMFIWEIDVYGNSKVPSTEILETLDGLGVGIGAFGPSIRSEELANSVLLDIRELSWFAINIKGSHADVLVRERVKAPEIIDEDAAAMVYAEKGGLIVKMSVLDGTPVRAVGDTVAAGDVLVSGVTKSLGSGTRFEHARAEVWARTWYELTARTGLRAYTKAYTGREKTKFAVIAGGKRINLYFNSGIVWGSYDKITEENALRLPTGGVLPLTVVRETYTEYEREPYDIQPEAAEELLKQELTASLQKLLGGGEITGTAFETSVSDGVVYVTLRAECREQIAAQREPTAEELHSANGTETNGT